MGNLQFCTGGDEKILSYSRSQNLNQQKSRFDCNKSILQAHSQFDSTDFPDRSSVDLYTSSYQERCKIFNSLVNKNINKKSNTPEKLKVQPILFADSKIDKQLLEVHRKNSKNLKKATQVGPPEKVRWSTWKVQVFAIENMTPSYDLVLYEQLINMESNFNNVILKDVPRTFPDKKYFKTNAEKTIKGKGYNQLYNILKAISNHFPVMGYTQGMNFIIAFLVIVSQGLEMETFFFFLKLAESPQFMLLGLFEDNLPLMKFLEFMTEKLLKRYNPSLYFHFKQLELPAQIWSHKWFLTIFLYSFPMPLSKRFWDIFITNGIFSLPAIAISIFKQMTHELLKMKNISEIMNFLQSTNDDQILDKSNPYYINANTVNSELNEYMPSRKEIQKFANQYIEVDKSKNDYVEALRFYSDQKQFEKKIRDVINQRKEVPFDQDSFEMLEINDDLNSDVDQLKKSIL